MSKENNSFIIRKARTADAKTLASFNVSMALETEDTQLDLATVEQGVLEMIETPSRGLYFVAEKNNKIQACTMITFEWSDWRNANIWWIQSVYVVPNARRQGVFRQLYHYIKELSIEDNACGIRLYVENNNTHAKQTYQSLGLSACSYQLYEELFVD